MYIHHIIWTHMHSPHVREHNRTYLSQLDALARPFEHLVKELDPKETQLSTN
jgi:hypothetical protein